MTRKDFEEMAITEEQFEEMFGEKPVFDDDVNAQQPVEVKEEADAETVAAIVPAEEPKVEVPVEAKAEVIAVGEVLKFENIKAAAEYLAEKLNLKVTNTLDGLYKTIRRGSNKTHGYTVARDADKMVTLTPIA